MRLNVNRLLHTPDASQEVRFEMDLSQLDFGGAAPIIRPVTVEGRLRNQAGVLLCQLEMHTTLHCVCDRCMEEFDAPKSVSYSCVLAEEKQEEDSDEIILLEHDEVDLAELARDAFILDMDTKTLCSEDCKGLCPGCGVNLNREPCRCKKQVDPRLAKLASLLQEKESSASLYYQLLLRQLRPRRCQHGSTQGKSIQAKTQQETQLRVEAGDSRSGGLHQVRCAASASQNVPGVRYLQWP